MIFYLGTHEQSWLGRTDVPLFLSARRLRRLKSWPIARGPWALDSGGFSEIAQYGGWRTGPMAYSTEVRGWRRRIGKMQWAAIQDWMCEPPMVARTGQTVLEHQHHTVHSYVLLRRLAADIPWAPVIQGYRIEEYLRCVGMYGDRGVDLRALPVVGVGSVCRRESSAEIAELIHALRGLGLKNLHGFGMKSGGLRRCGHLLASSDSMAWSAAARRRPTALPGCPHVKCNNCMRFALEWREGVLSSVRASGGGQGALDFGGQAS